MKISELNDIVERRYGSPATFVSNVRLWLHENRLTQLDLARVSGFDPSNVNRWLRGHVVPSLKNMIILDEALERLLEEKS